jgi:hypothetical protein
MMTPLANKNNRKYQKGVQGRIAIFKGQFGTVLHPVEVSLKHENR